MPRTAKVKLPSGLTSRQHRRGGPLYFYADLRAHGGKYLALKIPGTTRAVTDQEMAIELFNQRLSELKEAKHREQWFGIKPELRAAAPVLLELSVVEFHEQRLQAGKRRARSTEADLRRYLDTALEFFGTDRNVKTIKRQEIGQYLTWLRSRTTRLGQPHSEASLRNHLVGLSTFFSSLVIDGVISSNPVTQFGDKPVPEPRTVWLDVDEAALVLGAAADLDRTRAGGPMHEALVATYLLTGARLGEVAEGKTRKGDALRWTDIGFDRNVVKIRGTKTKAAVRVVPLWPQLKEVLGRYSAERAPGTFVFPSLVKPGMPLAWWDAQDLVEAAAAHAEALARKHGIVTADQPVWRHMEGEKVTTHILRHSFTAARLQTSENGRQLNTWQVSRELGHANEDVTRGIYAHLGDRRMVGDVLEYRLADWHPKLAEKLAGATVASA